MNERIKQLWEEAAKTTQGDSWQEQTKFMEKFAELIVGECLFIIDDERKSEMVSRIELWKQIIKHFGVEE